MQNSRVMVEAKSMYLSTLKDKTPILTSIAYFGVIENIWEIDYVLFKVILFKFKWVDNNICVQIDELWLTQVDIGKTTYMTETFIMAIQTKQVFYVIDPSNIRWPIITQGKHNPRSDVNHQENIDIPRFLLT